MVEECRSVSGQEGKSVASKEDKIRCVQRPAVALFAAGEGMLNLPASVIKLMNSLPKVKV